MDVDYTAVGVDLVMTLYQVQMYIPFGDGSSYIFTISSDTLENTETMMSYLETMEFSSDPINNTDTSFVESSSNVVDTSSVTIGQKNALRKAIDYLDYTAFSRSGLIDQLKFEGFTDSEATYGVDHCGADWNEQAILKARDYLDYTSFSRQGLIDQLEFEGFSNAQAVYGVDSCNVDWNEQAAKKAQDYLDYTSFSRQGLIDQLLYEGFSNEQALYGVTAVGY
ncbi:MAG: Ltp family lipoprotein [Clostridia bacterium]|nr:Ltp family lipoprotein [Clostridia bacterium]